MIDDGGGDAVIFMAESRRVVRCYSFVWCYYLAYTWYELRDISQWIFQIVYPDHRVLFFSPEIMRNATQSLLCSVGYLDREAFVAA